MCLKIFHFKCIYIGRPVSEISEFLTGYTHKCTVKTTVTLLFKGFQGISEGLRYADTRELLFSFMFLCPTRNFEFQSGWWLPCSYTDNAIILLNFIFTRLHGYQITPGFSTNKQRHRLLLLKDGGYLLHWPIFNPILDRVREYPILDGGQKSPPG